MVRKSTYEQMEQRIRALEEEAAKCRRAEEALRENLKHHRDRRRMAVLNFSQHIALKLLHELRNPLANIGQTAWRMSREGCQKDKLQEYAQVIYEESVMLENAVNGILAHLSEISDQYGRATG